MKTTNEEGEDVKNIKREILKCFNDIGVSVKSIILFGSRARGDYTIHSDYDLLIIIKSEKEIDIAKNQIGTIVRESLKEGMKI